MILNGYGGSISFIRELPTALTLTPENVVGNRLQLPESSEFWSGDRVWVSSDAGLPLGTGSNADGYSMYFGGVWLLGSNRAHITSDTDQFYNNNNSVDFYLTTAVVPPVTRQRVYVYIDELDRVSFYPTMIDAINNVVSSRLTIAQVDFVSLLIEPDDTSASYQNAHLQAAERGATGTNLSDGVVFDTPQNIAAKYPSFVPGTADFDNADITSTSKDEGWNRLATAEKWDLNLDAKDLDTTGVGEVWGDAVKSLILGSGSVDFYVNRNASERLWDATMIFQLLMLTRKGAKVQAKLSLTDWQEATCDSTAGDLYYEGSLLFVRMAISTRADDLIRCTASFVTVQELKLRMRTYS